VFFDLAIKTCQRLPSVSRLKGHFLI